MPGPWQRRDSGFAHVFVISESEEICPAPSSSSQDVKNLHISRHTGNPPFVRSNNAFDSRRLCLPTFSPCNRYLPVLGRFRLKQKGPLLLTRIGLPSSLSFSCNTQSTHRCCKGCRSCDRNHDGRGCHNNDSSSHDTSIKPQGGDTAKPRRIGIVTQLQKRHSRIHEKRTDGAEP